MGEGMIHHESWYKEALEQGAKSPNRDDTYRRQQELLKREETPAQETLIGEAIQSWRRGQLSELERRAMDDPEEYFDLLLSVAKRANYVPFLTIPAAFSKVYELDDEHNREAVFDLAFTVADRDPEVRRWIFSHVDEGMEFFPEHAVKLVNIASSSGDPESILSVIKASGSGLLEDVPNKVSQKFYETSVRVGEKTRDPSILTWVIEPYVYENYNPWGASGEDFPNISWESMLAIPVKDQPNIEYQVTNFDQLGNDYWHEEEMENDSKPISEFIETYTDWSSFHWERPDRNSRFSNPFLDTGAVSFDREKELLEEEFTAEEIEEMGQYDPRRFESQQTFMSFDDTSKEVVGWMMNNWPPPNTAQEKQS